MNLQALEWYRNNCSFTENGSGTNRQAIVYFSKNNIAGAGYNFPDRVGVRQNSNYFGTPGEFNSSFQPSKYVSVVSPPNEGKVFFVNYAANPTLTKKSIFPGAGNNERGKEYASPYHLVKLYFPAKTSLSLNTVTKSTGYKTWS